MLLDAVALRDRLPNVRRQLDRASVLVSPSAFLKKKYVEYGFDPDRILFSRNGLAGAEALARVTKTGSDRIRFAFAGSLLWYKGVETLLRAFHDIDPERAELRIHGDHERHPLARAHFEELRPWVGSPAVRFCGAYANEDLPRIYAETDVLVVPSIWYENSPLTIQEAMAARTPVLASDLGAMKDLVRDGVNGRLFAPGNAADLATKVREILDDPAVIERWRAGITPVKTIEQNVGEMVVLYRQAMMQTEGPGAREHRPARPLLERPAGDYDRAEGAVREQGSGLVLLGPHEGESPSSVLYEFETNGDSSRRSTFELEIETQLLEGERRVVLGGTVLLNGSTVGSIPLHRWERGEPLVRSHRFGCSLEAGTNRLELVNRPGEVSGRCHLRLRRILLRSVPDRGGTEEARIGSAEHAIGERPSDEVEAGR